jgi:FeS assembly protein IscX
VIRRLRRPQAPLARRTPRRIQPEVGGRAVVTLNWTDVREIAVKLAEMHPSVKPLTVRYTDLHRWVREIPGFAGDPGESNEKILEAIQMAWLEEVEE